MKRQEQLKLGIIGYGKMGKAIETIAQERGHLVTAILDGPEQVRTIREHKDNVDVFVEFTSGDSAFGNISSCIVEGKPVVSGSTGWMDQFGKITTLVQERDGAFFYASNFSVGVFLFMKTAEYLSRLMNDHPEYDTLIEESHHIHKKDAPSGTALTLIDRVLKNLDRKSGWTIDTHDFSNDEIPVIAKRIGREYGHHKLVFHSEIDTITLEHRAFSRDGFALGAVLAAEFLADKKGVYGMEDMLGGK